jgi:hypothetical protein
MNLNLLRKVTQYMNSKYIVLLQSREAREGTTQTTSTLDAYEQCCNMVFRGHSHATPKAHRCKQTKIN